MSNRRLNGRARAVPFAGDVDCVVVIAHAEEGTVVALVPGDQVAVDQARTLAGDPVGAVRFNDVEPVRVSLSSVE